MMAALFLRWVQAAMLATGAACGGNTTTAKSTPPPSASSAGTTAPAAGPTRPTPEAGAAGEAAEVPAGARSPTDGGAPAVRDRSCTQTVGAPIDVVRRLLIDYDHYSTTLPNFGKSRTLRRTAEGTDVYLQVPILHGAANLWGVVRFVGPKSTPEGERIEGTFRGEGNVSEFHCLWRYRAIDAGHTEVDLDLLLLPPFPLPESIIQGELDSACRNALLGVKAQAERSQSAH